MGAIAVSGQEDAYLRRSTSIHLLIMMIEKQAKILTNRPIFGPRGPKGVAEIAAFKRVQFALARGIPYIAISLKVDPEFLISSL